MGLFTGREGYRSRRVNPTWRVKDSPGKENFTGAPTPRVCKQLES